jgi:hypothetical protein
MTVRFNLVNHNKPDSLFNYGLLPAVYSQTDARESGKSWVRSGVNVCYYRSHNWYDAGSKKGRKRKKKRRGKDKAAGKQGGSKRQDDSDDDEGGDGVVDAAVDPDAPRSPKFYFVATFTHTFKHDVGDVVYFAYCQPYTASRLQRVLRVRARSVPERRSACLHVCVSVSVSLCARVRARVCRASLWFVCRKPSMSVSVSVSVSVADA